MRIFAIAFLIGVCLIEFFTTIKFSYLATSALFCLIVLLLHSYFHHISSKIYFAILAGLCWVLLFTAWQLHQQLPKILENKPLYIKGYVVSLPEYNGQVHSFLFKTTKVNNRSKSYLLEWDWYDTNLQKHSNKNNLYAGEKWQLLVKLKRPHGFMNPGGFDYEKWLFEQQIDATGSVLTNGKNNFLENNDYDYLILKFRQHLLNVLTKNLNNQPLSGIIPALTIGYQGAITQQQWLIFRNTGTNHLLAIAGLHIGFVAGWLFLLANCAWRLWPRLCLYLPAQQFAAMSSLIGAICYSGLDGFSLPTKRAVIILAVALIALILKRQLVLWHSLGSALFIILVIDPLSVLSGSFWLSFIAVSMIIYGVSGRLKPAGWWWKWGRAQWVVACGLFPLTMWLFQQASFVSPLANFIAIPWIGFVVLPLSLLACLLLLINQATAHFLLVLAVKNLQCLWPVLAFFAKQPTAAWQHVISNQWNLWLITLAILLILAPRGFPIRYLAVIFLFPLLRQQHLIIKNDEAYFTLVDVGQGLSAVVQTAHHVLIYDTGAKFSDNFDAGSAVVVPFIKSLGISKVDMLMISHGDNDHIGGAASVLQNLLVSSISTSVPQQFSAFKANYCHQGQHWQWDGVNFTVLYPQPGNDTHDNDSSCVLKITAGNYSILLPGDIEKTSEHYLVAQEETSLPATFLIAPHHGSKTSSTIGFVQAVHPQYVLFPVGYLNRYHFPDSIVVQRYQQFGIKMLNSVDDGAISFILNNQNNLQPVLYRIIARHVWNA